jgi:hypothetical protein
MDGESSKQKMLEKQVNLLTQLYKRYETKYEAECAKTAQLKKVLAVSDKLIDTLQAALKKKASSAASSSSSSSGTSDTKYTVYIVSDVAQPQLASFMDNVFATFTNNRVPGFARCVPVTYEKFRAVSSTKIPGTVGIFLVTADKEGRWGQSFKTHAELYQKAEGKFDSTILGCIIPAADKGSSDLQIAAKQASWEGRIKIVTPLTADPKTGVVYVDPESFNQVFIKRLSAKLLHILDPSKEYSVLT